MPWVLAVRWAVRAVPTPDSDRGIDLFSGKPPKSQPRSAGPSPVSESLGRFLSPLRKADCKRRALLRRLRAADRLGSVGVRFGIRAAGRWMGKRKLTHSRSGHISRSWLIFPSPSAEADMFPARSAVTRRQTGSSGKSGVGRDRCRTRNPQPVTGNIGLDLAPESVAGPSLNSASCAPEEARLLVGRYPLGCCGRRRCHLGEPVPTRAFRVPNVNASVQFCPPWVKRELQANVRPLFLVPIWTLWNPLVCCRPTQRFRRQLGHRKTPISILLRCR
jgi:hypothetical protein